MSHEGHEIQVCQCGAVMAQCRCAAPGKVRRVVAEFCSACRPTLARHGSVTAADLAAAIARAETAERELAATKELFGPAGAERNARVAHLVDEVVRLQYVEKERDAARRQLTEARGFLLADEERRKLTGDALHAEAVTEHEFNRANALERACADKDRRIVALEENLRFALAETVVTEQHAATTKALRALVDAVVDDDIRLVETLGDADEHLARRSEAFVRAYKEARRVVGEALPTSPVGPGEES